MGGNKVFQVVIEAGKKRYIRHIRATDETDARAQALLIADTLRVRDITLTKGVITAITDKF